MSLTAISKLGYTGSAPQSCGASLDGLNQRRSSRATQKVRGFFFSRTARARLPFLVDRVGHSQECAGSFGQSVNLHGLPPSFDGEVGGFQTCSKGAFMANTITPVDFHGATLSASIINGLPHVAMRPIVEAIGLDWKAQYTRINRHPVLSTCMVVTTTQMPGDDQAREMFFLPVNMLNGWLFGVSASRVKPALRETLVRYQRECFDVLARHFGAAPALPAIPYAVLPGQTLSADQADTLRNMLTEAAQNMPKDLQGLVMREGWSKLKAHFKTSYREIPAHQFTEAVSLLSRHIVTYQAAKTPVALPGASIQTAMAGANAIAARVQASAFEQFMAHGEFEHNRWMLCFHGSSEGTQAHIKPIPKESFVMSFDKLAKAVNTPGEMLLSNSQLATMAQACNKELSERFSQPALRVAA